MIVALGTVLALLAVPTHEQGSQGSTLTSPCPNVFVYDPSESEPGSWSGVVTLTTDILLHSTWLNIRLDSQAINLLNWVGNATTQDGIKFIIENDNMQIHPGHPVSERIFIQYDPLNTTPRLREIRLNGKVICNADTHQRNTVGRPIGPPSSSFSGPFRSNLVKKPMQIPPSEPNYPVYRRPVNNNSSAAFNPEHGSSNTSATSEMVECGVVSSGHEGVSLSYKSYERGDIPWLAAVYTTTKGSVRYMCGGTLVTDRHVVSAASCIKRTSGQTAVKDIVVKVGAHYLNDQSEDIAVTRTLVAVSIHEDFNPSTLENNIMILSLNKRVKFNQYIRPACLWSGNTELSLIVGATGVVAGWGVQTVGDMGLHNEPHIVHTPIVSIISCRSSKAVFHELTSDKTLCAGARNGEGPCLGDSGAGLHIMEGYRWRLRGIVSVSLRGDGINSNCNLNEYIVYTDTAQYLTWMRHVLSVEYINYNYFCHFILEHPKLFQCVAV